MIETESMTQQEMIDAFAKGLDATRMLIVYETEDTSISFKKTSNIGVIELLGFAEILKFFASAQLNSAPNGTKK